MVNVLTSIKAIKMHFASYEFIDFIPTPRLFFPRLIGSAEIFMRRADDDGDNLLNFREFADYMLKHEHDLKLVFKSIDVDRDGAITLYEIQVHPSTVRIYR